MNWYNTELTQEDAIKLKQFLRDNNILFETSGCYNLIHFEIFCNEKQCNSINYWIDKNLY